MSTLDFSDKKPFGKVQSVDTSAVGLVLVVVTGAIATGFSGFFFSDSLSKTA